MKRDQHEEPLFLRYRSCGRSNRSSPFPPGESFLPSSILFNIIGHAETRNSITRDLFVEIALTHENVRSSD